jgi:hypothetical protein
MAKAEAGIIFHIIKVRNQLLKIFSVVPSAEEALYFSMCLMKSYL